MTRPEIIPAILTSKTSDLKAKLRQVKNFRVRKVQIDIADGKFVPNRTIGSRELKLTRSSLEIEAHLMVYEPQNYVEEFAKAHTKTFIFHIEAAPEPKVILSKIKKAGMKAGLALNPKTSLSFIEPFVSSVDLVLFLSVEPGFQGRGFIAAVLDKITEFRNRFPKVIIGIDGGIKLENFTLVAGSGVNEIVIGSALWQTKDPKQTYQQFLTLTDG